MNGRVKKHIANTMEWNKESFFKGLIYGVITSIIITLLILCTNK